MQDLLENVLRRGLDMAGPDHLWYHGDQSTKIIRKRARREIVKTEADYAIALLLCTPNFRTVARWLRRDDTSLRRAVNRRKSVLTLVK